MPTPRRPTGTPMAHPPAPDEDARWTAVCNRDRRCDGSFVYGVRTTGVYCRPSCGARRPLRRNVEFHATSDAAEAAGFRPCRRCRPDAPAGEDPHDGLVTRVCRAIDEAMVPPTLAELARIAGMSPSRLHRVFRSKVGVTPKAYAAARRSERSRRLLHAGATITEALYEAGYGSSSAFYGDRAHSLGMTASAYRRGAAGVDIRYAIAPCWLGHVLAAATPRGACAILLGDTAGDLVAELTRMYPHARHAGRDVAFERLLAQVVALVSEPESAPNLALDIRGTAFQQRVWEALRAVPPGRRVTYAELARRIGAPGAVRAVGRACATNALAIAVPCHRAVRTDGGLAGYRWGVERKRALLDREASAAGTTDEAAPDPLHEG